MPRSRAIKIVVRTLLALVLGFVLLVGIVFCRAISKFMAEERICGAFHPVIHALSEYQEAKGALPTNLAQLVPTYLPELPAKPVADAIDYQVLPDGTNWQLTVHSRVTGPRRVFLQRSTRTYTDNEQKRIIGGFHGWVIFPE